MSHRRIDVSGVQPAARPIVAAIARAYVDHLNAALVTLVAHGSAVKGGIVAGSSDVDTVAFLRPECLTAHGELPLDIALELHRDLVRVDPAPFRYLQGHVQPAGTAHGLTFIPGTFHIVTGSPDIPTATGADLLAAAHQALAGFDPGAARALISNALLDHGERRLDRQVRWTCTDVWPLMYQVACVHLGNGLAAWQRTKHEVLAVLEGDPIVGEPLARWFEAVTAHYANGETLESALTVLSAAAAFYDAVARWNDERQGTDTNPLPGDRIPDGPDSL